MIVNHFFLNIGIVSTGLEQILLILLVLIAINDAHMSHAEKSNELCTFSCLNK